MKYQAKQLQGGDDAGKWAVFTGSKYFPDTVDSSKAWVERRALEMSAQWYQRQVEKAEMEWRALNEAHPDLDTDYEWGDVLC